MRAAGGQVSVETDAGEIAGTHLLVAAGRVADLGRLDPAAGGVAVDGRGVRVDGRLRSVSNRAVFALGDASIARLHEGRVTFAVGFGRVYRASGSTELTVGQRVEGLP